MDTPEFGFSGDRLRTESTVFAPDLFRGKVVVVSGAGSGLGRAIATLFARLGADLAICGRDEEKLTRARAFLEGFGGRVFAHPMTIRDPEAVGGFIDVVHERLGRLDVPVNNAGGGSSPSLRSILP